MIVGMSDDRVSKQYSNSVGGGFQGRRGWLPSGRGWLEELSIEAAHSPLLLFCVGSHS